MGLILTKDKEGSSQLLPFLKEGHRVMRNGVKKDVSRYGIGSESSKKDSAKSCKRPKKLASVRYKAKDEAIEIQKKQGKLYDSARYQVDMFVDKHATEEIKNPHKFLASEVRKLERQNKKQLRRK